MFVRILSIILLGLFMLIEPIYADDLKLFGLPKAAITPPFDHSHSRWTKALNEFVIIKGAKSRVRYDAIRKDSRDIQKYLDQIGTVTFKQFLSFSEAEQIAFLINVYNAYTITLIVNNPSVSSIKDIGGWLTSPWKIQFFKLFQEMHSLDDIEHEFLRKRYKEPRIHFALVCASVSCPALRSEAFVAQKLDQQLDEAGTAFIGDRDRNYFEQQSNTLYLSSIFKWYGEDFSPKFTSASNFVLRELQKNHGIPPAINVDTVKIEYLSYDWSLNDASKP